MHRGIDSCRRGFLILLCGASLLMGRTGWSQAEPAGMAAGAETIGPHESPVMGLNLSVEETGVHGSSTGWADVVTPTASYRLSPHFLVDASVSWFPLATAYVTLNKGNSSPVLRTGNNLLGDTFVAGHFEAEHRRLGDIATVVLGLPTGNVRYGLGAGSTTYNVTNHTEYRLGFFTPDLEFGEGNNSTLANPVVRKAYVATGPLANFQAGGTFDLPLNFTFDGEAYEDLPLGNQNVNGTVTHRGKHGKGRTSEVLQGAGSVEDNGINGELDYPLGRHLVLMGIYERSFVQGLDTVSGGITWTLRTPKGN